MLPFSIDPNKDTICDVIRRWAELQPDAPAILQGDKPPVTYGALIGAIDDIRTGLNQSGFGRGDRIGLIHSGGADMASLLLGIISGATAVPLDPRQTASEYAVHFCDRKVSALIVEPGLSDAAVDAAKQLGLPVLETLVTDVEGSEKISITTLDSGQLAPPGLARQDDVALVFGTSGTTDRSKIVPRKHKHLLARASVEEQVYEMTRAEVGILIRPLYFSGSFNHVPAALYSGGSFCVLPSFEITEFFRDVLVHGVTWYTAGPTFQKAIRAYATDNPKIVEGLRLQRIRVGSGSLEPEIADDLERIFSASIETSYSSTETGRIALTCGNKAPRKKGTVGISIDHFGTANSEVQIRSPEGNPMPPGARGEIVVKGDQVVDSYENDAEANAAAFVDGWFHTGDEGLLDAEGYLTLTGRIKEMINRGGEKVSPAEVDAALLSHPEVREAATFPIPHQSLGEEVAAAVVAQKGSTLNDKALTKYLLERLTGFKVPRRYIFVDDIPKGETGKVQRYKLAEDLGLDNMEPPSPGEAPQRDSTPLEAQLQSIWAKVLRRDSIGLDDNFFLAGGDSLQAVDLFLEVEKVLGRRLPVACLFEAGTVAEMAVLIEKAEPQGCMVAIQPKGTRPPFFCIHGNGGEVIGFYNLARHLGTDQPFYGIQSVGWEGETVPFTKTDDMAAHYLAELRKIQPHGPYYIGGYSFGGRIAVYMANILKAAGEDIQLLALLDTTTHMGRSYVSLGQWLELHEASSGAEKLKEVFRYAWFRIRKTYDRFYQRLRRAMLFPIWNYYRATGKRLPRFMRDPRRANRLMRLEHGNMPIYQGDAVYFMAEPMPRSANHADVRGAWDKIIGGNLEVIHVPGDHAEIIKEPFVQTLARELDKKIAEALSR
jgi:acyl-CoA synthetase (AMP-forming)/AMP-acid ligase II/thioesterase domain-containing protein/acyl carrier protein